MTADPARSLSEGTVAVIGGGIAGAAASAALRLRGLPVLWIAPPREDRPRAGESLAAAARPLLETLGAGRILDRPVHRRMETSFSNWGTRALLERSAMALPGGLGTAIDRNAFEKDLLGLALDSGATRLPTSVHTACRTDSGWWLRTIDGGTLTAGLLVDATGRSSLIGRRMTVMRRQDRMIAAVAFLRQRSSDIDPTRTTLIEAVPDGWWYASLLADGCLAVNHYTDPDLLPRGLGRDQEAWGRLIADTCYISKWIDTGGFEIAQAPDLTSAGSTWLDRAAGPDWIAVGDAAAAFDPLSAHGMTTALWTAINAAEAVSRSLAGDTAALDAYADRVADGVARFRAEQTAIYRRERRFARHPFWTRRNTPAHHAQPEPIRSTEGRQTELTR